MRERRRPKHTVQLAKRSKISEASVIQRPVNAPDSVHIDGEKITLTWSGNGVHANIVEIVYPVTHDNIQGNVDRKGDEREEGRKER